MAGAQGPAPDLGRARERPLLGEAGRLGREVAVAPRPLPPLSLSGARRTRLGARHTRLGARHTRLGARRTRRRTRLAARRRGDREGGHGGQAEDRGREHPHRCLVSRPRPVERRPEPTGGQGHAARRLASRHRGDPSRAAPTPAAAGTSCGNSLHGMAHVSQAPTGRSDR